MGRKFYFWGIVVPGLVLAWIGWDAYSDITEKSNNEVQARQHHERTVLAERARIDAALKARPPQTLAQAQEAIGDNGWCGRFKAFNKFPTATWSFRSQIPLGDTRVWPTGNESIGIEVARASVESCDSTAQILSITVATPEYVQRGY